MPELYIKIACTGNIFCTDGRFAILIRMDDKPIAAARANLTELVASVRLLRRPVQLSRRGKPQAVLVPVELAEAAEAVGGPDAAAEILRKAVAK
jgi:prevent-host-death family protein